MTDTHGPRVRSGRQAGEPIKKAESQRVSFAGTLMQVSICLLRTERARERLAQGTGCLQSTQYGRTLDLRGKSLHHGQSSMGRNEGAYIPDCCRPKGQNPTGHRERFPRDSGQRQIWLPRMPLAEIFCLFLAAWPLGLAGGSFAVQ